MSITPGFGLIGKGDRSKFMYCENCKVRIKSLSHADRIVKIKKGKHKFYCVSCAASSRAKVRLLKRITKAKSKDCPCCGCPIEMSNHHCAYHPPLRNRCDSWKEFHGVLRQCTRSKGHKGPHMGYSSAGPVTW